MYRVVRPPARSSARKVADQITGASTRVTGPPTPPGPLDRLIPSGVNGFSTAYTNVHPVVHFRLAYINGAASSPTISVTVDGNAATLIGQDGDASIGASGCIAFFVTGLAAAAHTIAIAVSAGTVTMAALRVGELVSQTSIGEVAGSVQSNPNYYIEVDGPTATGAGQVGSIACFANASAFEVYPSYADVEQWSGSQTGMAFRFATDTRPSGEGGGLFVFYSGNGGSYNGAGLVYEIIGGVLP